MITDVTHRELPASGRGCFAAVVIVPIAAFAGLTALTTLFLGPDDQAADPVLGLPHLTRASETTQLGTEETAAEPAGSTIAERPLALRKPDTDKPGTPKVTTTAVTVPSTVVATSTTVAGTSTPCTGRTTPVATTTTTTTTTPPTTTTSTTTIAPTTTVTTTTTTVAPPTTTSTSNAGVPK
jgi:hypothetical protein